MLPQSTNTHRRAYTLLEVILASGLTAVVLLILATSMQIQYRAFNSGRSQVEEAQVARVLLHRIGDDLKALLPPRDSVAPAATEASSEGEEDAAQVTGLTDDESDVSLDDATASEATPILYGELDWVRVDVVHATRRQSEASEDGLLTDVAATGAAGEIKTIVYYAISEETTGFNTHSTGSEEETGGLVRRELSRPAAEYGAEIGTLEYYDTSVPPIAKEVTAVEFRYHDGEEWLETWDSSESGELPKAIEVRLFLARKTTARSSTVQTSLNTNGVSDDSSETQYRLVVPIALTAEGSSGGSSDASDEEMLSDTSLFGGDSQGMGGER